MAMLLQCLSLDKLSCRVIEQAIELEQWVHVNAYRKRAETIVSEAQVRR